MTVLTLTLPIHTTFLFPLLKKQTQKFQHLRNNKRGGKQANDNCSHNEVNQL